MLSYLGNENTGRNEVKYEAAIPDIEFRDLLAPQDHTFAQLVCRHKCHIPAQQKLYSKGATCMQ